MPSLKKGDRVGWSNASWGDDKGVVVSTSQYGISTALIEIKWQDGETRAEVPANLKKR